MNREDDIIRAYVFACSVNCTTDNRGWNGVEYEGTGIQKNVYTSTLSSSDYFVRGELVPGLCSDRCAPALLQPVGSR